ncbi:MAG: 3'-5' exonuclease [Flavobacteriaceae bacterium]|nr:3'-5' exonuclease [Flavobacteriaceae bacterium]
MIHKINLEHILFLDIETVPQKVAFSDLNSAEQELWAEKTKYKRKENEKPSEYYKNAGIWAEFGQILCISAGFFTISSQNRKFRITSFSGNEVDLLTNFNALLNSHFNKHYHRLCAHNGKEFDFPFLARRNLINGLELPVQLQHFGKKPWEVPHLDTMELWKFGDFKHYTSLKLLAHVLGVPSPKEDMDGSKVRDVYYLEKDIERIIRYCETDVVTIARIFLKLQGKSSMPDEEIIRV